MTTTLPTDSAVRKQIPLARGVLDYFPAALAEVAMLSQAGNDKHNPGEELHHARGKSMDHADCLMRHLAERGAIDTDGLSHTVKVAWRALAMLQEECEALRGAPLARAARLPGQPVLLVEMAELLLGDEIGAPIRAMPPLIGEWVEATVPVRPLTRNKDGVLGRWPDARENSYNG